MRRVLSRRFFVGLYHGHVPVGGRAVGRMVVSGGEPADRSKAEPRVPNARSRITLYPVAPLGVRNQNPSCAGEGAGRPSAPQPHVSDRRPATLHISRSGADPDRCLERFCWSRNPRTDEPRGHPRPPDVNSSKQGASLAVKVGGCARLLKADAGGTLPRLNSSNRM